MPDLGLRSRRSHLPVAELPELFDRIWRGLQQGEAAGGTADAHLVADLQDTAVKTRPTSAQIRRSVTPDVIISFEDGRAYKTLKRHLTSRHMTPASYREKWGLPPDYPMTSASYSAVRSETARRTNLGKIGNAARATLAKSKLAPKTKGR